MRTILAHVDVAVGKDTLDDKVEQRGDSAIRRETAQRCDNRLLLEAETGVPGCEGGRITGDDELLRPL